MGQGYYPYPKTNQMVCADNLENLEKEMTDPERWEQKDGKWLYGNKKLTAIKAIHQYCINECCYTAQEVTKCDNIKCLLWCFRRGNNPNRKGVGRITKNGEKARSGKYKPSRDGKKKVNIKAFSDKGKLEIILPSGDVLTVDEKSKK